VYTLSKKFATLRYVLTLKVEGTYSKLSNCCLNLRTSSVKIFICELIFEALKIFLQITLELWTSILKHRIISLYLMLFMADIFSSLLPRYFSSRILVVGAGADVLPLAPTGTDDHMSPKQNTYAL
jgi:hypothetical protein